MVALELLESDAKTIHVVSPVLNRSIRETNEELKTEKGAGLINENIQ